MEDVDTLVIGAGHAGLAMSRSLTDRGLDHVVLERGRPAERWRSERWDSLRLLTPNWMARLPGFSYAGSDPHGYMSAAQVVDYFERYATSFGAPLEVETTVEGVQFNGARFRVSTDKGDWRARQVVVATGYCDRPTVPDQADALAHSLQHLNPSSYRNPSALPPGGVLVVGAGATGVQIAHELARAGRDVVLAVGRHSRLPRTYRGQDIWWWLERLGTLDATIERVGDPQRARREPSLQLAGRRDDGELNLAVLRDAGVRLAGRLTGIRSGTAHFADDLAETTAVADARMRRVLSRIEAAVAAGSVPGQAADAAASVSGQAADAAMTAVQVGAGPRRLALAAERIGTVVWATGYRRSYSWLKLPVLDAGGELRHRRGVTVLPGLYAIGLRFQHRRNSSFIDGARHDAEFLADHIASRCFPRQLAV